MTFCPVCGQPLPDTPTVYCPNCGANLAAPPGAGTFPGAATMPGDGSAGASTPWERREVLGWVAALVDTTRLVLGSPSTFFRSMPVEGGIGSPLLYGVIVGWIGVVAASFYQAVFRTVLGASAAGFGDRPEVAQMLAWVGGWAAFVGQVVFGGVLVAVGVFVSAGVLHLMLLLLGGARRGFEATLRVVSFAQATSLLFLLPFCGQLVGGVWSLVLYVIGLAEAHQIGHGKAIAAVLLPFVILCCCCGGLVAMIVAAGGLASQMR